MTTDHKLKILFGLLSIGLLTTLLIMMTNLPGGMILSGLVIGGIIIVGVIVGCLIVSGILKQFVKKTSFLTIFFITTTISFIVYHYQLYSPTLPIIVPNGYRGEINLVLSNVEENILKIDSNGIGYITEWTFNKAYSRPVVKQTNGVDLDKNLVGFNPTSFFGKSISDENSIRSLSFKIIPDNHQEKNFYTLEWMDKVDKKLVVLKNTAP